MNKLNSCKKTYVAPQLQELGEHSVIVKANGNTFTDIDNTYIQDNKSYATFS